MATDELKLEAQQALDELFKEGLLPFELKVMEMVEEVAGEHTLRFHDSRLRSVTVAKPVGQPFKDAVRAAMLARVAIMSGSYSRKRAE